MRERAGRQSRTVSAQNGVPQNRELRTGECGEEAHSQIFAFILERVVRHEESDLWPSIESSGRTQLHKASAPNRFDF
jgi:hypothetical protein